MPQVGAFFAGAFGFGSAASWGAAAGAFTSGVTFAGTIVGGLTVKLLTSVAISALQQALTPSQQGGGVTIATTLRGEDNPETVILGRYATAGQCVYVNSHGKSRRNLTHVVEICSAPGATLNRLMLGDTWVTIGTSPKPGFEGYGLPVTTDDFDGHVFIKYYDGRQTTADAMLVNKYSADPDRPWASSAVGAGLCYAILTFIYDQEDLPQVPAYKFEVDGIPLYDPRRDSTNGGSGSQRWSNPATWAQTDNPAVMIYNLLRGVPLPGGEVWGGGFASNMLPVAVWIAAMNRCDQNVPVTFGVDDVSYRAGIEAVLTQEPAAVATEILKAMSGTIADMGYAWVITAGGPGLPVYAISDDDVIVSKTQTFDPFPALSDTHNAVAARYPDPEHLWETREAPLRTDDAAEDSDAFGRRTASLTLPAVPYRRQVQRLSRAWLRDERRFRRHILTVPPDAAAIELIDTLDWTSARNGYQDKTFSLYEIAEDPRSCLRQISIRERNPADYDWEASAELPLPPSTVVTPKAAETVSGFSANAVTVTDAAGRGRRPGVELQWDPEITARGLRWQIRLSGQSTVRLRGDTQRIDDGTETITAGVLPGTSYEVRARLIAKRKTLWTGWIGVTTPAVYIGSEDVSDEFITEIERIADIAGVMTVAALPTTGEKVGQIVSLLPTGRLYRWNGSAWVQVLASGMEPGSLDATAFAASIKPVEIVSSLPGTPHVAGRVVYLTSDGKVYRNSGTGWVASVAAADVTGQLTSAQIASLDAAKLAGQITSTQIGTGAVLSAAIADAAITAAKIGNGSVTEAKVADAAITTAKFAAGLRPVEIVSSLPGTPHVTGRVVYLTSDGKVYRNSGTGWVASVAAADVTGQLTSAQIASLDAAKLAGQITSAQIGTGAVLSAAIADAAITAAKIGNGSVTEAKIADAAVSTAKFAAGLRPVEIVSSLPGTPHVAGRVVYLTSDGKLYRNSGTGWVASVAAADVTGQLTSAQIATLDTAKLAGQITSAQIGTGAVLSAAIADAAVSAVKIAAAAVTAAALAVGAVTADAVAANAITSVKIATGAVTAGKVAANSITATEIAAGTITATEIAAGAITASKLAVGAVTADAIAANAITVGKVAAGAIGATEIAARGITASKLALIDTDNLVRNASFEDELDGWYTYGGTVTRYSGEYGVGLQLDKGSTTAEVGARQTGYAAYPTMPVTGGEALRVKCKVRRIAGVSGGNCGIFARIYFADGTNTGTAIGGVTASTPIDTTVQVSGVWTVPANATGVSWQVYYGANASSAGGVILITDASVTRMSGAELIVDGAITAVKVAANAIEAAAIATGAITSVKIAAGAVTADAVAANAITSVKIAAGAVTAGKVAANSITATEIAASTITATEIATGAITSVKIAAGAVTADAIAANAIVAGKIAAGAIGAAEIAANAITSVKIAAGAVTAGKVAANSITATEIAASTITATEIATGAITSVKIATGAVTADAVAANAITSVKIAAGAVTAGKVAANSITATEIAAGTITATEIAAAAITAAKLAVGAVTADAIAANAIVAGKVAAGAIGATEIAADAIVARHLVVADYSNMVLDSELADPTSWTTDLTAQITTATWYNMRANRAVQISGTYTAPVGSTYIGWWAATKAVPVEGGRDYALSCVIDPNSGSTGAITVNVQWLDPAGAVLDVGFVTGDATNAARQEVSAILTAPATAIAARLYIRRGTTTAGGTCTGVIYIGNLSLRRAASADLIVDGSINAAKLISGEVITNSGQIRAAIINDAHIANASVGTLKIGNQAVSADWNSYTAGWITFGGTTGGSVQVVNISDPTVNGCVAWVTFTAVMGLQRPTGGRALGSVTFRLNGTDIGTFDVMQNVAAGVEIQIPISLTRRVVLPSSGTHEISVNASNVEDPPGSGNVTRLRYRRLEINVMKR